MSVSPYYEQDGITIYHGDCREIMPTLSGVSMVVTDPPYVFGLASTFDEGKAGGWGDMMNAASIYAGWLREFWRLVRGGAGCAWVFNSWRSFPVLARGAHEAQWPIESLLIWDKERIGPGGMRGLRPTYEVAALFCHPDFQITDRSTPDIWRSKWCGAKEWHPAEKPIALLERMILAGGANTGTILDAFAGSGSTLVAAKRIGRRAIGIEIEERYCEIAAKRLAQGALFGNQDDRRQVHRSSEPEREGTRL